MFSGGGDGFFDEVFFEVDVEIGCDDFDEVFCGGGCKVGEVGLEEVEFGGGVVGGGEVGEEGGGFVEGEGFGCGVVGEYGFGGVVVVVVV